MDVTGNFKHKKLRLQDEGFDPSRIDDPLYFRDESAQRYVSLDPELFAEIQGGSRRL